MARRPLSGPPRRSPRPSHVVFGSRRRALNPGAEGLEVRDLLAAFVAGEVLIQFKPGVAEAARGAVRGASQAVLAERIHTGPMQQAGRGIMERVTLPQGRAVEAAIQAFQNNPAVEYAEPNWIYTHETISADQSYTDGSLWGMYGDDSPAVGPAGTTNPFGSQAETAWAAGSTGSKLVYVGIIDEGIQFTHPDLDANVWNNPYDTPNGVDDDGNGLVDDVHGWDFAGGDNTIYDGTGDDHGTHVTGTIGAEGTDAATAASGPGVVGVNWDVTYISGKFLGATGGTTANAIKAVDYFTDLKARHGLNIVATSNSWGGGGYSQSLHDAIIRAARRDILFIAAAGNGGSDQVGDNNDTTAGYPSNYNTSVGTSTEPAASYDAVIAVAAIDSGGNLAGFSNYGAATVDLGAPGVGIRSTLPTDSYGSYSGTSMATPHVSGAAALYAAARPGSTASQIKQALLSGARATGSLSGKTVTGGRLDVKGALNYASPTTPPAAPSTLSATATSSAQVALTWADNSTNEQGFRVERSTNGGPFAEIATTGADATGYTATGLAEGTPYTFRVRAYNAAGTSDYSSPASATTPGFTSHTIFTDNFAGNLRKAAWQFKGGSWSQSGEAMRQTSTTDAPEKKAIVTGQSETAVQVTARVRVDSWKDGEYARAGVSLFVDPATGQGYNLIFTGRVPGTKRLEFLNDGLAWSGWDSQAGAAGSKAFNWTLGAWYQFKFRADGGILSGKVWADGTAEPADWTLTFDANRFPSTWGRTAGAAGLNGGAAGKLTRQQGRSYATVSFDDVLVDAAGPAPSTSIAATSGTRDGSAPIFTPRTVSAGQSGGIDPTPIDLVAWPTLAVNDDLASDFLRARRRKRTT